MLARSIRISLALALGLAWAWASMTLAADDPAPAVPIHPSLEEPAILTQLLRSDRVARELRLDRSQRQACAVLVEKVAYPLFLLRDLPADAKRERIRPLAEEMEQSLNQQLTQEQRNRLSEILLRAQGWSALLTPRYASTMNLAAGQVAEMQSLLASAQQDTNGRVAKTLDARIYKLLSGDQRSAVARLSGQSFDLSQVRKIACRAPELTDISEWVNSPPRTLQGLRGQVVALHYFAFGCINCIHNQPHYKDWHQRFAGQKFIQLALHTPETEQERDTTKLRADVAARELPYPIAVDARGSNWNAWANHLWPSTYLIDKQGYVRYWWYGELNWQGAQGEPFLRERISELLAEAVEP